MMNALHFVTLPKQSRNVFYASLLVFVFWTLALSANVYWYVVVGVLFEILWLPMIAALFVLPVLSFIFWAKQKFIFPSLYCATFLLSAATVLLYVYWSA